MKILFNNCGGKREIGMVSIICPIENNYNFRDFSIAHIAEHCMARSIVKCLRKDTNYRALKLSRYVSGKTSFNMTMINLKFEQSCNSYVYDVISDINNFKNIRLEDFEDEKVKVVNEYCDYNLNSQLHNVTCKLFSIKGISDAATIISSISLKEVTDFIDKYFRSELVYIITTNPLQVNYLKNSLESCNNLSKEYFKIQEDFNNSIDNNNWGGIKVPTAINLKEYYCYELLFIYVSNIYRHFYKDSTYTGVFHFKLGSYTLYKINCSSFEFRRRIKEILMSLDEDLFYMFKEDYEMQLKFKLDHLIENQLYKIKIFKLFGFFESDMAPYYDSLQNIKIYDVGELADKILKHDFLFSILDELEWS